MRVLLVEDKETWNRLFDKVLSLRGFDVIIARTRNEAVAEVSRGVDVAVVDHDALLEETERLVKTLRESGVPVLVIGNRPLGFDPGVFEGYGALALEKPFTVEDLVGALQELLGKKRPVVEERPAFAAAPSEEEIEPVSFEEEVPVLNLDEEEGFEVEAQLPPLEIQQEEIQESEKLEEKKEFKSELVEKVTQGVSQGLSELPMPQEKIEQIVREIAWEVIPEVAEKIVREEVEKLIKSRLA